MQFLAIDRIDPGVTEKDLAPYLIKEVVETIGLYLEDKIRSFYFRKDRLGVIFLLEGASLEEAKENLNKLPLVQKGMLAFDLIPIGPLKPLEVLLERV